MNNINNTNHNQFETKRNFIYSNKILCRFKVNVGLKRLNIFHQTFTKNIFQIRYY